MGATDNKDDLLKSAMSLGDHLEELRMRLLLALAGLAVGAVICLFFGKTIIFFLQAPYNKLMPDRPLIVLAPAEAFLTYMKISLIAGLVVASPWVFYQIWMFIAAGLYPHEKKYVHIAAPFCAILFITGSLFFVFIISPISLAFFLKFGSFINVTSNWTFQKYISLMSVLMLVFGVAFQTPIAIFFLNKTGLVSLKALTRSRKYVLFAVVVIAAMVTPPDVVSQIALAIPLYVLFELSIVICRIANLRKTSQAKD